MGPWLRLAGAPGSADTGPSQADTAQPAGCSWRIRTGSRDGRRLQPGQLRGRPWSLQESDKRQPQPLGSQGQPGAAIRTNERGSRAASPSALYKISKENVGDLALGAAVILRCAHSLLLSASEYQYTARRSNSHNHPISRTIWMLNILSHCPSITIYPTSYDIFGIQIASLRLLLASGGNSKILRQLMSHHIYF